MSLLEVARHQTVIVEEVAGDRAFRRRIMEMGLVPGTRGEGGRRRAAGRPADAGAAVQPAVDPQARSAARPGPAVRAGGVAPSASPSPPGPRRPAPALPLIALGGNPNVGKTTLFNVLTGSRARVGNYPGVTVEKRLGEMQLDGVGRAAGAGRAGHLLAGRAHGRGADRAGRAGGSGGRAPARRRGPVRGRHPAGARPVPGAAGAGAGAAGDGRADDDRRGRAAAPDPEALGRRLGCPVVPVVASKGKGIAALRAAVARRIDRRCGAARAGSWRPGRRLEERSARCERRSGRRCRATGRSPTPWRCGR